MTYSISGRFIEACDCRVICPCWVSADPDNGSCTGFFAWRIDHGEVDGIAVAGSSVISVSTHLGNRRVGTDTPGSDGGAAMLFIDAHGDQPVLDALTSLFTDISSGPVADILAVIASPALAVQAATIAIGSDSVSLAQVNGQPDSHIAATIEPVTGADHDQVAIRHQLLDPALTELHVGRGAAMDIAIVDPNPEQDPVLEGTYLFDFTKPHYSASTGPFSYSWPRR